jgi:hypothetical protein
MNKIHSKIFFIIEFIKMRQTIVFKEIKEL